MEHDHQRFSKTLVPLENTEHDYRKVSISRQEGEFLWDQIREQRYEKTIEIGCALGVSSLYICDATSQFANPSHTIIDPYETSHWSRVGIQNLQAHGVSSFNLLEEPSELALPKLLAKKETFDFGFIDGCHSFDHTMLEFFYLNRMVRVGGMIVFDDANWPSISKLLAYASRYPAYKSVVPGGGVSGEPSLTLRQHLFRLLCHGTKLFPREARAEIFSQRVLSSRIRGRANSSIVGLMKVAEDERSFDWFEPF